MKKYIVVFLAGIFIISSFNPALAKCIREDVKTGNCSELSVVENTAFSIADGVKECQDLDGKVREGELNGENIVYCEDGGFSFEARNAAKNHNYYEISPGIKESDMQGTVFYLQTIISTLNILEIKHEFRYSKTHG
jgi:hypothetical protein